MEVVEVLKLIYSTVLECSINIWMEKGVGKLACTTEVVWTLLVGKGMSKWWGWGCGG